MGRPLIANQARLPVLTAGLVTLSLAVALGIVLHRGTTTSFDTWVFNGSYHHGGSVTDFRHQAFLLFSEPAVSLLVPLGVLVFAVVRRDLRLVALTAVGPLLALALTELVGKPLVQRYLGPHVLTGSRAGAAAGSYPSGHTTATIAWLTLVVVVALRYGQPGRRRRIVCAAAGVWAVLCAAGQALNFHHYATDTVGAIALTVGTMLLVALAVDAVAARRAGDRRPQLT